MPRTDVPPTGQGKRSKKRAWRENADQAIAIYSLTAEEAPEIETIKDLEAMSHALPYWDDAQQAQMHSHTYSEEEVQEMVDKAYQEGWQEGIEEGYKLGKDKGYKEYKAYQENKEEQAKDSRYKANEGTTTLQDTWSTSRIITRVNATTQTDHAAPKACASVSTTHNSITPQNSGTTATADSQPLTAASRDPTSSISLTASTPSAQIVEISEIDHQAVPGGTTLSKLENTAASDPQPLPATSRNTTSSIAPIYSSQTAQIIEIAHTGAYNTPTSSNNIQDPYIRTGDTLDNIYDPYVVYSNPQNAPKSVRSNLEKKRSLITEILEIPEHNPSDLQNDGITSLLVDLDTQEHTTVSGTSRIAKGSQPATYIPQQLPPLPSKQILDATPYKRTGAPSETSDTLTEPNSDPNLPEKPTVAQQASQGHIPGNSLTNSPIAASEHIIPSLATPSFIIHAQTVIINNYPSNTSLITSENGTPSNAARTTSPKHSSWNSESKRQVPVIPPVSPPPRDLSALRSNSRHRPFASLRRRSNRRQSASARGPNWNNHHPSNWSRNFQSMRWIPPICQSF